MNEKKFQKWYAGWARKTGINPNPDAWQQYYDYRSAYKSGAEPTLADDGYYHWPSKFKDDLHPNRYIEEGGVWRDTKYGKIAHIEDKLTQDWQRREYEVEMKMR